MKKFLLLCVSACMVLSLTSCSAFMQGFKEGLESAQKNQAVSIEETVSMSDISSSADEISAQAGGFVQESSGVLGNYAVDIKECELVEDANGKVAVIVTFGFTNNGDKSANFKTVLQARVYQGGSECGMIFAGDDYEYDDESIMKEVEPGASCDVQCAYSVKEDAPIDVEVTQYSGKDNGVIVASFE